MKRKRNIRKKKNNLLLLILLVLGISVGYAILSTTLNINGIAGIKKNTWDIHWDSHSVSVSEGSVSSNLPRVYGENDNTVEFTTELELPGDFYEFTVDAINEGTIDGVVTAKTNKLYEVIDGEEQEIQSLPSYILYTVTYEDGTTVPAIGDFLDAGESQPYKIRVEYDRNSDVLPETTKTYKFKYSVTYQQYKPVGKYKIKFNANGGTVTPVRKEINQGDKVGELPVPTYADHEFIGWYTGTTEGVKINSNTVPAGNTTYYARWTSSFATFDTGTSFNQKIKLLAGNTGATYTTADTNITSIVKSNTEPIEANKTVEHIVSVEGSEPIYAWYSNGTIYYWSAADTLFLNEDSTGMFSKFRSATQIDLDFNTSKVTNMTGMFSYSAVQNLDLSGFDTGNVVDMNSMFATADTTSINLSSFDTSKVTNMSYMFAGSKINSIDVSGFNTINVQYISQMFVGCTNLTSLDLSTWDTRSITSVSNGTFSGSNNLKVINMSNWRFDNCPYFSYTFQGLTGLETVIFDNIDTSNVISIDSLFQGCTNLKSVDLSDFNTSNLLYMSSTFYNCSSLTSLDLSSFDTIKVTYMSSTFAGCSNIETITVGDKWTTAYVSSSSSMFGGCVKLVGGLGTTYNSNFIDKTYAHYDYGTRDPGYFNKGKVDTYTLTFNPTGGSVSPRTKRIDAFSKIGELPVPTKPDASFGGWYTEEEGGTKISKDTIPEESTTYYAHWLSNTTVTYNSNGGTFENSQETNVVNFEYKVTDQTIYSHTDNVDDDGVPNGTYNTYVRSNDVVTIEGADTINIELWYSTGSQYYDWMAIYQKGITPDGEYNVSEAAISGGKLYGGYSATKPSDDSEYHKTYVVDDDTAQFYFYSSGSSTRYYGYYAIITGTSKKYEATGEYAEPTRTGYVFTGWNTEEDGSGVSYKNSDEVSNALGTLDTEQVLYAQWRMEHTITFNANGGVSSEESRVVLDGNKIGTLPTATNDGSAFAGWYTEIDGGTKIDDNYIPTTTRSVFAHWDSIEAKFDTGKVVNVKMKTLAGTDASGSSGYTSADNNITSFERTTTVPNINDMTADNILSAEGYTPIYGWFDNGTLYWYSTANKVYTNEDASYMFSYLQGITNIDTSFDTTATTNMANMIYECRALENVDVSNFDTSNVTTMAYMFAYDQSIVNLDVSNFNTSNVTDMYSTFYGMNDLEKLNVSNWDFRKYGTNTLYRKIMGYDSTRLKRLIADNTIYGQDMSYCFASLENLEYLSVKNVDTSDARTFYYMFNYTKKIEYLDLSDFDTSKVTNMSYVFYDTQKLKDIDLSTWNTKNVTTLRCFMYDCYALEKIDLSSFNTSKVTDMSGLLGYCNNLKEVNLSNFDFSKWNSSSALNYIFSSVPSTLKILVLNNTKYGSNMQRAFGGLNNVEVISLDNVDTSSATTMSSLFESDSKIKRLYLDSFDTSNVTNMGYMFSGNSSLKSISVSDKFITGKVTSSNSMFNNTQVLSGGNGTEWNSSYIDKSRAHYDYGLYNPGYFNNRNAARYKVTFDANGGSVAEPYRMVWKNDEIGTLPEPKWEDHVFDGWFTDDTAGIQIDASYVPNSDVRVVAHWHEVGKYTINLNANGGYVYPKSIYVVAGNQIGELPTPIRPNWTFDGWYTEYEGGIEVTSNYVPDCSRSIIAHWIENTKYTVTFDPNGGTVDEGSRQVYINNQIGALPEPYKELGTSAGWFTGLTDGIRITPDYIPTSDITVYARWTGWVFVNRDNNPQLEEQQWSYYQNNGRRIESGFAYINDFYGTEQKYFFENGIAHIGWLYYNGDHYFLSDQDDDKNGYVNCNAYRSTRKWIDGRYYTFDSEGRCIDYERLEVCDDNISEITTYANMCSNNNNIQIDENTVCRRALTLHQQECTQTHNRWFCSGQGLQGSTITYGNCGTSGQLHSGDAFTCDVNGDGNFDELTERFYYVSDYYNTTSKTFDNSTAVLIYYNDVSNGISCDSHGYAYASYEDAHEIDSSITRREDPHNFFGPITAKKQLPTTTQWSNVNLKNTTRTILGEWMLIHDSPTVINYDGEEHILPTNFSYEGYAARLLTAKEMMSGCGLTQIGIEDVEEQDEFFGELDSCIYLLENSNYAIAKKPNYTASPYPATLTETPVAMLSSGHTSFDNGAFGMFSAGRHVSNHVSDYTLGVRPVIEVPKNKIKY